MLKQILAGIGGSAVTGALNQYSAKQNRRFQQEMSNTAYQRAATDLEKAGLNRILALGSPASTPGGSTANFPDFGQTINQAASTASQVSKQTAETSKIVAETTGITAANQKKIVESQFWKAIGPSVVKAAGSAEKFMGYLSNPKNWPTIQQLIKDTSQELLGEIRKVIKQNIPKIDTNILNFVTTNPVKIGENWGRQLREKLINLGPGGPE